PLVRELAAAGFPVAVSCRVLKSSRLPYYRWLAAPVPEAEVLEAYRANALFDAMPMTRSSGTATWPMRLRLPVSPWQCAPRGGCARTMRGSRPAARPAQRVRDARRPAT